MFKDERIDEILKILREEKYTTVESLVDKLHYSPATIRRDLNYLASLELVNKSYGGVSINEFTKPAIIREHENATEKNRIAQEAAKLVKDGDNVFIDGTTTTYCLGRYLLDKKNITVVTSNLKLALYLSENGMSVYCTGGKVVDTGMLNGIYAVNMIKSMNFDICFFSVACFSEKGILSSGNEMFSEIISTAVSTSKKSVCMMDSEKFGKDDIISIASFDDVNYIVSDYKFSSEMMEKFNTNFILV